ncbi:MAG: hypothetical protein QXI94_06255 [Sulfolobales archaeon]
MSCEEALFAYERTLSEAREFRVLGSTEAAIEVVRALARVVDSCRKLPVDLGELVHSAVSARPTSQAVRNLLVVFFEKLLEKASTSDGIAAGAGEIVREVENYVARARDTASELASRRIEDGDTIMTHSYSTTVLKAVTRALERGLKLSVYVTESRPGGEGKLTASYLGRRGIKTFLVVDSAVRYVMKNVDKVVVSAEAIAANGAVVNKVGTSALALAAKEARVRVYVVSGLYKFGTETVFGELVTIEEMDKPSLVIPTERIGELTPLLGKSLYVRTPLYDVTPPEYIDAIVTERGLIAPQASIYLARELVSWPKAHRTLEVILSEVASLWR